MKHFILHLYFFETQSLELCGTHFRNHWFTVTGTTCVGDKSPVDSYFAPYKSVVYSNYAIAILIANTMITR